MNVSAPEPPVIATLSEAFGVMFNAPVSVEALIVPSVAVDVDAFLKSTSFVIVRFASPEMFRVDAPSITKSVSVDLTSEEETLTVSTEAIVAVAAETLDSAKSCESAVPTATAP